MFEATNYISEYNVGDKFISFQYTNGKRFAQINVCQNKKVERNKKKIEVYQEGNAPLSLSFSTEDEAIEAFDLLNTTLDTLRTNCQTANAVVTLFPNGREIVTESRDFRDSDAGKRIFVNGTNTTISMPEVNPFAIGDYVGIISEDTNNSFNVEYGGESIYPLKIGDGSTSECVILMNTEVDGDRWLFPISTSFKYDETDSLKKTALRYLYDKSQNAIPLSGTEVGKPVTGKLSLM